MGDLLLDYSSFLDDFDYQKIVSVLVDISMEDCNLVVSIDMDVGKMMKRDDKVKDKQYDSMLSRV